MPSPGFSLTLSKTSLISKILQFLVVNTGSILIGPPLKIFLPTPLPGLASNLDFAKGKGLEPKFKKFPKLSEPGDVVSKLV